MRNLHDSERLQNILMAIEAMRTRREPDNPGPRSEGPFRPDLRILDHHAIFDSDAELSRGEQIEVGLRLAACHMLAPAVDMVVECIGQAEMVEVGAQPARRARRGDRPGQIGRKRAHELDRAGDRANAFLKRADGLGLAPLVKFRRQRPAHPPFKRVEKLRPAVADELLDCVLDAGPVAEVGQELGEQAITLEFALEQHAVEIEDDSSRHQSSNNAEPTRTAVAPSITAAL